MPSLPISKVPKISSKTFYYLKGEISFMPWTITRPRGKFASAKTGRQNILYFALCCMDTLDHDYDLIEGQRDDRFRCLVYASDSKIDNQKVAFHCYEDLRQYHAPWSEQGSDKLVLAGFVPLGWLRKSSLEAGKDPTLKHITNYVVLWNTSTKPHALWICYYYYRPDFDGCGRRRKLGKPTCYNVEDDEFGPQGCAFPFEEDADPDEESPGGRDIVLYDGYDDPYEN